MMNDHLISRSRFLDALVLDADNKTDLIQVHQALEKAVISPDEVRGVGEWIMLENQSKEDTDNGNYWYTCSHCSAGDLHAKVQEVPFCWKCGARMKGVSEE